jgi:maltooligosyltrehalose trehalohydrolase
MGQLAKALEHTFVYDGSYSDHRKRAHGKPPLLLSQHHFLGYIQNHDQVGNRAVGDRLPQITGFERAMVAAAVVMMSPFVPMIFQGEEWAASSPFQYFADHQDPALAKAVSEGRCKEFEVFGWDPTTIPDPENRDTFVHSKLKWDEANQGDHARMKDWYRDLIRLRRSTLSLNNGGNDHEFPIPDGSTVLLRSRDGAPIQNAALAVAPDSVVILQCPGTKAS